MHSRGSFPALSALFLLNTDPITVFYSTFHAFYRNAHNIRNAFSVAVLQVWNDLSPSPLQSNLASFY